MKKIILLICINIALSFASNVYAANSDEKQSAFGQLFGYIMHGEKDFENFRNLILTNPRVIYCRDASGGTPLHWCVNFGNYGVLDFLLARGANPNVLNDFEATPLHYFNLEAYKSDLELDTLNCLSREDFERAFRGDTFPTDGELHWEGLKIDLSQYQTLDELYVYLKNIIPTNRYSKQKARNQIFEKLVSLTDDVHLINIINQEENQKYPVAIEFIKKELEKRAVSAGKAAIELVALDVLPKEVAGIVADYVAQNGGDKLKKMPVEKINSVDAPDEFDFSLLEFVLNNIFGRG